MSARYLKIATVLVLLRALLSVGAMAQSATQSAPTTPAPSGVDGWISGHPMTDFFVVLVIIVVIVGTYLIRQRSRA